MYKMCNSITTKNTKKKCVAVIGFFDIHKLIVDYVDMIAFFFFFMNRYNNK